MLGSTGFDPEVSWQRGGIFGRAPSFSTDERSDARDSNERAACWLGPCFRFDPRVVATRLNP